MFIHDQKYSSPLPMLPIISARKLSLGIYWSRKICVAKQRSGMMAIFKLRDSNFGTAETPNWDGAWSGQSQGIAIFTPQSIRKPTACKVRDL